MSRSIRYPPPFRANAVARVYRARSGHRSDWATIQAVATELGINAETLRGWVRQAEIDAGRREGTTTAERQELFRLRVELANARRALDRATPARTTNTQPGPPAPSAPDPRQRVATATIDQLRTSRIQQVPPPLDSFPDSGAHGGDHANS